MPLERIIPADAGMATVDVVAATEDGPNTRLSVLPEPNDAVASPVTVNVSPADA